MPVEALRKQFPPYVPKKGETYMSERQRAHFREILGALREELSADIERTVHQMQDDQTVFADPNDRASRIGYGAGPHRDRERS
jgi:DnaK suppressor protein